MAPTGPRGPNDPDSPEAPLVAELKTSESAETLRDVGDGLSARRERMPELFPELNMLIAAGPHGAAAMLPSFSGRPNIDEDESLSIFAFALEQIGDEGVVPDLVAFLDANTTGEVPSALSAVTHAVRVLEGMSTVPSTAYLISEIEETIAQLSGGAGKVRPTQQLVTTKESCNREFYLLDANRNRVKDADGNDIRVGGTVFNPSVNEGFATSTPGQNLANRVREEGGTAFDYVDPESRVTYQGEPTRRFNCAGFAFRNFVNGRQWTAHPDRMFNAFTDGDLLEEVDKSDSQPGDFVFFRYGGGTVGHVAVVETVDAGLFSTDVTVINADGPTGMFRASTDVEWFQKYTGGAHYYRWRNGPPSFEAVTERTEKNSCFGTDLDGDGWPELVDCTSAENCIDPVIGGIQPDPGFRAWRVTNYGSAPGGYIRVLRADADEDPPLLSGFPGGGISPDLRAELSPVTDPFPTSDEVVDSLCDRVSDFFRPVLASFILQATFDGEIVSIDSVFQQRCAE